MFMSRRELALRAELAAAREEAAGLRALSAQQAAQLAEYRAAEAGARHTQAQWAKQFDAMMSYTGMPGAL